MGQISILHISDIHYFNGLNTTDPSPDEKPFEGDWTDLDEEEQNRRYPHLIRRVKKSIFDQIQDNDIESIIISGDLCHQGDPEAYDICLKYLKSQFHQFKKIDIKKVVITAGNHDIDKDFNPENVQTRFIPFLELLTKHGFNKYSLEIPLEIPIGDEGVGKILLVEINTCIEFGSIDQLPKYVIDLFEKHPDYIKMNKPTALQKKQFILERLKKDKEFSAILDIPYLNDNTIENLSQIIKDYPTSLPIIIGHHSLLPMRSYFKDRPFNCIINGGKIRERLMGNNKDIIYLHGHIHDDPLDAIISPMNFNSENNLETKLICSSAPTLFPLPKGYSNKFGFNIITITFSNCQKRRPLGCDIKSFFLKNDMIVEENKRIHFHDSLNVLHFLNSEEMILLQEINKLEQITYFKKLYNDLKQKKILETDSEFKRFTDKIELLGWLKLIKVSENSTTELRTIKKVFP